MRIDGIGGIYELISVMRLFSGPFKLDDITRETGRAKRSVLASMQRLRRRGRVAALGRDAEDNARLWRFRG